MAEVEVTQEDVKQAQALQTALSASQVKGVALDVCSAWRIVKPFWPWIIKLVKMIPKVGDIVAKALEFIGEAMNKYCAG
jgi:hypothetical protein